MTENRATKFRVQIRRQQEVTVDLKFPMFTLSVTESFIPSKAQAYPANSSIDIPSILKKIEETNYAPQIILDFEHEGKNFLIWIE